MSDAEDRAVAARAVLERCAREQALIPYQALADAIGLTGPGVIRQVAAIVEQMMREDAAQARPMLAALVVSRSDLRPRRGFFDLAVGLGRFPIDTQDHDALWEAERDAVWREAMAHKPD